MPYRDFGDEPLSSAQEFFDVWVGGGDERIAAFRQRVQQAGGPADAIDFDPESLPRLFSWIVDQIRIVDELPDVELPEWLLPGPAETPWGSPDPQSAWLLDGLDRYFAELLVRHIDGMHWKLVKKGRGRNIDADEHQPVLEAPGIRMNPRGAGTVTLKQAEQEPEAREPGRLLEMFRYIQDKRYRTPVEEPDYGVDEIDDPEIVAEDGWRWSVWIDHDLAHEYDDGLDALTARLAALPGVDDVDHDEREAWLVAGTPRRRDLDKAVRGWLADQRRTTD